ncbi:signal peptidase II [Kitasatospora sp. NPDC057965]|uniref:signal peptidase II n=1 Tax=Kitasatospora sp. NPDC057965 TaxID=3346291 RepID=UPI0036DC896C
MALAVLASDLITKQIAVTNFSGLDPTETLGGLLKFTLAFNSGGAFSIGEGETWFFTAVKMTVIVLMLLISPRIRTPVWAVSFGLVIAGAAGNLADRLFRAPSPGQGLVVDWIQLPHWPVFNLADCGVVCGSALVMWTLMRGIRLDGTRESEAPAESGGTEPTTPGARNRVVPGPGND